MKEVNEETRQKISQLCKDYLGGKWTDIDQNDLDIKPIPHGNVNKLYFCLLPKHVEEKHNKVVVRLNTEIEEVKEFRCETHIIAMNAILSENGITPKLLAVFDEGMINEMCEGRYFVGKDDKIDKRAKKLATKLADFHSLRMPLPKARNPGFDAMVEKGNPFIKDIEQSYEEGYIRKLIEELKCETHLEMNLFEEFRWLVKVIDKMNNPVVFSHNDFNRKNILIHEIEDGSDEEIFIIDFDWTSYNYRGLDLGQYFSSWGQTEPEFGVGDFPSDQEMSVFLNAYIKRKAELFGESYAKQGINSLERLIKESKIFALNSFLKENLYFTWRIGGPQSKEDDPENVEHMKTAENRFQLYKILKKRVLQEYDELN